MSRARWLNPVKPVLRRLRLRQEERYGLEASLVNTVEMLPGQGGKKTKEKQKVKLSMLQIIQQSRKCKL